MSRNRSAIARFFSGLWHLFIGLYRVFMVLVILAIVAMAWYRLHGVPIHVGNGVALVVHPQGALVEETSAEEQQLLQQISGRGPTQTSLRKLREALDAAAGDTRIRAAVLDLDDMTSAGLPQLAELARAVDAFRKAGKPVYAYGSDFDQYQYALAAHADDIALDPMGGVMLLGLGVYSEYFKDALDKLGVKINVFRVGQFKSAVEPFIRNDMSPEARLANQSWLNDLWQSYLSDVSSARKLKPGTLSDYIDGYANALQAAQGNAAQVALKAKLVDEVETRDAFRKRVEATVGKDPDSESFRQIDALRYLAAVQRDRTPPAHRIGEVVVQGDIVDGDSTRDSAGGDTIAGLLDDARDDDSVVAVVLRVNSPGGSVSAAEKIRRAVLRLKAAGKPVVVSMSTLAASGGYWISMDADRIFAEPTTITGSIGIFGLLPEIDGPLNTLGIHTDGIGTTTLAGAFRIDRPLDAAQQTIIQSQIDFGYAQFTGGVAKGRGLPLDTVQQIAQGRVWSGLEAKKLGLVDAFGGLADAERAAAGLARVPADSVTLKLFRPQSDLLHQLMASVTGSAHARASVMAAAEAVPTLRPLARAATLLGQFNDPRGEYAYCFCTPATPARP